MTDPSLPPDREAEIRAGAARSGAPADDLVAAAAFIRASLLASVPDTERRDFAAQLDAGATAPRAATRRVRAAIAVTGLVAAGSIAAGMAGALPVPLQDVLREGGTVVGIHLPSSDERDIVDTVDIPVDRPLWDDGHPHGAPADGHSHLS